MLVEIKFQPFRGGFLQAHQLIFTYHRIAFVVVVFVFNIIMYRIAFLIWNIALQKFKVNKDLIAFSFFMFFGIATATALVVQFQLHTYFADAMDAKLLKNIAGGSIRDALLFVLDELILFFAGVSLLLVVYYFFHKLFRKYYLNNSALEEISYDSNTFGRTFFQLSSFIFASIPLILVVNSDETLRFNLRRINSYTIMTSALNAGSDIDRDGYGIFSYPTDPENFNATIYPGALDIPDNGIDEDGFFGDFTTNAISNNSVGETKYSLPAKPKNIVVIFMESTRAEVVGLEIEGSQVSPNVNKLEFEGRSFHDAYSHTGFTTTSLGSFFTGTLGKFAKNDSIFPILKNLGYEIAVFSGQDENFGENDVMLGISEYADRFFDAQIGISERVFSSKLPGSIQISEATTWREFKKYSDGTNWNIPHFIYFNMQAGHFPYYHENMVKKFVDTGIPRHKISEKNREWLQKTYWNAVHFVDIYIGKIIDELKAKNLWDDTLLIITADHGEELFDDGHLGHGFLTSDVQTRIPLVTNKKDFFVQEPIGHSDMKEYILQYALQDNKHTTEPKNLDNKSVFQFIGTLDRPKKISLRYLGGKQIILDLDNMLVRPISGDDWMPFVEALEISDVELSLQDLIFHWEHLRWMNHQLKVGAEDGEIL